MLACNNNNKINMENDQQQEALKSPAIKTAVVNYQLDALEMKGFVAYDSAKDGKRPVVLVVHEWWGLNEYVKGRVDQLAALGYLAMAVDMYGNGSIANDPQQAIAFSTPLYKNPQMAKARFDAAIEKIKTFPQADSNKIAAIGYCFGGTQVLNMALMGENLAAVVSFHGGLETIAPEKNKVKAKILICHGEADSFVPDDMVAKFRKGLDSIGANYIFKSYPDAQHAFTNPASTMNGKKFDLPISYNAAADTASWTEMRLFLEGLFK
ncbi:MAG: dienelactone hydrolase family protein [Niastella sp.]|nr:dienelactone hydrolase family protein [Niastella sp.]